jgi:hypothetical protein
VFRAIAALALASSATSPTIAALDSSAPWWERVTVTIGGDGQARSCRFESSLQPNGAKGCEVEASQAAMAGHSGAKDQYTRITFERRFSPDARPDPADLPTGDMLLGQQVMALAITARGTVDACQIVSASGDMKPDYGCKQAVAERFHATAASTGTEARQAYMTILVYGHSEHMV